MMSPSARFLEQLLLSLVHAASRQELLDQLLTRVGGLQSATLWWQADGVLTAIGRAGEAHAEGEAVALPNEPRYRLSITLGISLSAEVLAVLGLRLMYLDAQQALVALSTQRATLELAARTDILTGLLNRRAFDTDLDAIDLAGSTFAVVLIDLDGFKTINDRFGHAVGDSLLRGYGAWLTRMIGTWGSTYRMGGDEYLILVTGYPGEASEFSAWAYDRLQVPFVDGVSASIGIAWRHESWRVTDVVRLADQRMYDAKNARPGQDGPEQERSDQED